MKMSEFVRRLQVIGAEKPDTEVVLETISPDGGILLIEIDDVILNKAVTGLHIVVYGQE